MKGTGDALSHQSHTGERIVRKRTQVGFNTSRPSHPFSILGCEESILDYACPLSSSPLSDFCVLRLLSFLLGYLICNSILSL